jgi:regulator of sigma D
MKGDEILSSEFRWTIIEEYSNGLLNEYGRLMKRVEQTSDIEKQREIFQRLRQIQDIWMLYILIRVHELELRDLKTALTKLPSTGEFQAFKTYLTEGKELLKQLEPIKKLYAKYAEDTKRVEEYRHIG